MIVCGWEVNVGTKINTGHKTPLSAPHSQLCAHCVVCNREVYLTPYITAAGTDTTSQVFDVTSQHNAYCTYVNIQQQSVFAKLFTVNDGGVAEMCGACLVISSVCIELCCHECVVAALWSEFFKRGAEWSRLTDCTHVRNGAVTLRAHHQQDDVVLLIVDRDVTEQKPLLLRCVGQRQIWRRRRCDLTHSTTNPSPTHCALRQTILGSIAA